MFDAVKAREAVTTIEKLNGSSSFRNILKETARQSIIKDHKTLRLYLNLLVAGKVLSVRTRDVGSVYRQEIYALKSNKATVWAGLDVLQRHGLNWGKDLTDMRPILTDFEGLVRSKIFEKRLMASLEDCLVNELYTDAKKNTGTTFLVIAMISTMKVDLPYLLRRADQIHIGRAIRFLFRRILEIASSNRTEFDGAAFLVVRDHFLRIARQYAQTGFWNQIEHETGKGKLGLSIVNRINESEVISAAGKQLGVIG